MNDIYQAITDRILAGVDDAGQWRPCWRGLKSGRPSNALTGHHYRGVNVLSCWLAVEINGWSSQQWGSYQQWQTLGAQVRKGEKGTPIVFYKQLTSEDPDDNGRIFARSAYVFNADQVDGWEGAIVEPQLTGAERIGRLEEWVALRRHAFLLSHTPENRAYYRPADDRVNMPAFELFDTAEHYYATLFHELTHWTGAKHRLDREFRQSREDYAKEELVAELGAAFLAADLGIETTTRDDHVNYIASWLKALKDDKRLIVRAASLASAAADYLTNLDLGEERIAA